MRNHLLQTYKRSTGVRALNIFLIGYCIAALVGLCWSVFVRRTEPGLFSVVQTIGFLCGGVGLYLYFNASRIIGVVVVLGQIAALVYNHFAFRKILLTNPFFWLFAVLVVVLTIYLAVERRQQSGVR